MRYNAIFFGLVALWMIGGALATFRLFDHFVVDAIKAGCS